jgi:predicted HNH restriction endonuclease
MIDYNSYAWKKRRLKFIESQRENLHCALCNKKAYGKRGGKKFKIHIHHMNYDYPIGQEPDSILRTLCPSCHEILTMIMKRKPENETISRLQTIIVEKLNTN